MSEATFHKNAGLENDCEIVLRVWSNFGSRDRLKFDKGSIPWSHGRPPLEKCQNGAGGVFLDNLHLNNSLTHSNSQYFKFAGKNVKIRPP